MAMLAWRFCDYWASNCGRWRRSDVGGKIAKSVMDSGSRSEIQPRHFAWRVEDRVATITLNRPERKNPLTFESYNELIETFQKLAHTEEIKAVVITGAGDNFCSGGDVHEIIGPLVGIREQKQAERLLSF